MGVPADVVLVEMGVHDEIDVGRLHPGGPKAVEPRQIELVPEDQVQVLAVADARIDEDRPPGVPEDERLHAKGDGTAVVIGGAGRKPRHSARDVRRDCVRIEEADRDTRRLRLDHRRECGVADLPGRGAVLAEP